MVNGEMFSFDVRYNILPKMLLLAQNFLNIPRDDEAHPLIISRPDIISISPLVKLFPLRSVSDSECASTTHMY